MRAHDDMVKQARLCAKNAHQASMPDVARELSKMAQEYQRKAGKLDGGKLPDIGKPPPWL